MVIALEPGNVGVVHAMCIASAPSGVAVTAVGALGVVMLELIEPAILWSERLFCLGFLTSASTPAELLMLASPCSPSEMALFFDSKLPRIVIRLRPHRLT